MTDPNAPNRRQRASWPFLVIVSLVLVAIIFAIAYPGCVAEGTLVDTPLGPRPIESLAVGDEVWTVAADGAIQPGRVRAVHAHPWRECLLLEFEDGSELRVTENHPIATETGWIPAGNLRVGDRARRLSGWTTLRLVVPVAGRVCVYDLEVEPNSNFVAGGILVHNKSSARGGNERNASATLKTLATAEAEFRSNDRDNNHVNDFWVADVSGLYRIQDAKGATIQLIEKGLATGDAAPCIPLDRELKFGTCAFGAMTEPSQPKSGYWFKAIPYYEVSPGKILKYDDGTGHNRDRFAFCAYPAEYGKSGRLTFIVDEGGTIFKRDTGGATPIDCFPLDPTREWSKMD